MDTIDNRVMEAAGSVLQQSIEGGLMTAVHTVTVTLNGAHGGADVTIEGEKPYGIYDEGPLDGWAYELVTITVEVH